MILCEHFIFALFNGIGYKLIKTSRIDKILHKETLYFLCHIGDNVQQEAYLQIALPLEGVIAISFIRPVMDEFKRKGVWNHTILIKMDDYIQLTQPATMFQPHFIRNGQADLSLEPIKL